MFWFNIILSSLFKAIPSHHSVENILTQHGSQICVKGRASMGEQRCYYAGFGVHNQHNGGGLH